MIDGMKNIFVISALIAVAVVAFVAVFLTSYIVAFPVEYVKSCVWTWPPEPFNKICIAEANYNASEQAKNKADGLLTSLFDTN